MRGVKKSFLYKEGCFGCASAIFPIYPTYGTPFGYGEVCYPHHFKCKLLSCRLWASLFVCQPQGIPISGEDSRVYHRANPARHCRTVVIRKSKDRRYRRLYLEYSPGRAVGIASEKDCP